MLKRLKVVTGHQPLARFYMDVGEYIGFIPRQKDIPSPYAYSPTHIVSLWKGTPIIIVETKHRRHVVFEVPPEMVKKREKECY